MTKRKIKILSDHENELVVNLAVKLTQNETSVRKKLENLFYYVRDEILFYFPENGDLMKASETIKQGGGQCNTKGTLLVALCRAVGIPARIRCPAGAARSCLPDLRT